jgi:hypothetical protein
MIRPMWVSTRPTWRYIKNIGMATTTGGNMRVDKMKKSKSGSPVMRNRENPYAVIVPIATARKVLVTAMIRLLRNRFG